MNKFKPYLPILADAMEKLDSWRSMYGSPDSPADKDASAIKEIENIAHRLASRLEGNYPFHHPSYAGQMLKPPHPVAWLSYALAMTINPNNHALDGGPPTSAMEKEIIEKMAKMVDYGSQSLGHLTSGGTVANLEALYVAREIHPDKAIAASANAHYTHQRMCRVLNCDFIKIPVDQSGNPDLNFILENSDRIGTVVVTLGTTGLGIVEPLHDILDIASETDIRIHADAAYGGFFKLIGEELTSSIHWKELGNCDSIVIDPHKHGLQPYGCGSVLYRDASVGKYYKHDSPYTYFTSDELHLGEISLECSRAGAAAAAFWATLELYPLTKDGLGRILFSTIKSSKMFADALKKQTEWKLFRKPDLDIVSYFREPEQLSIGELNKTSRRIFNRGVQLDTEGYHLSLFKVPAEDFIKNFPEYKCDADYAIILRSVLMKEEHEGFIHELIKRLTG